MMVLVVVVFALRVTQTTIDRPREETQTTAREIDVEGCCCCCWSTQLI